MDYRIDKEGLFNRLSVWNGFLNKINEISIDRFIKRFQETAYYDISEDKINKNLEHFLILIKKKGLKW